MWTHAVSYILRLTLFVMRTIFLQTIFIPSAFAAKWCSGISDFFCTTYFILFFRNLWNARGMYVWLDMFIYSLYKFCWRRHVIHIAAVWYFIMKIPFLLSPILHCGTNWHISYPCAHIYIWWKIYICIYVCTHICCCFISTWKACCENAQFSHFN